jgi:hypothetical protein
MLQTSGNKKRIPQRFGIHSTTKHKPLTHPTQELEMKEIIIAPTKGNGKQHWKNRLAQQSLEFDNTCAHLELGLNIDSTC